MIMYVETLPLFLVIVEIIVVVRILSFAILTFYFINETHILSFELWRYT